jgi:hypothetical protein
LFQVDAYTHSDQIQVLGFGIEEGGENELKFASLPRFICICLAFSRQV